MEIIYNFYKKEKYITHIYTLLLFIFVLHVY
jgi:hypothetical protein